MSRRRIVVDASAALRVVMRLDRGGRIAAALDEAVVAIAPDLFAAEVANGLRSYVRAGAIDRDVAVERFEEALDLVDDLVPCRELGVEALAEAARLDHPAYDLVYGVLARRTGASVLTRDRRLQRLLGQLGVALALASPS